MLVDGTALPDRTGDLQSHNLACDPTFQGLSSGKCKTDPLTLACGVPFAFTLTCDPRHPHPPSHKGPGRKPLRSLRREMRGAETVGSAAVLRGGTRRSTGSNDGVHLQSVWLARKSVCDVVGWEEAFVRLHVRGAERRELAGDCEGVGRCGPGATPAGGGRSALCPGALRLNGREVCRPFYDRRACLLSTPPQPQQPTPYSLVSQAKMWYEEGDFGGGEEQ